MLQYRVTFENRAGLACLAITVAADKYAAVTQVRESVSDYGRTLTVESQPLTTVTHIPVDQPS